MRTATRHLPGAAAPAGVAVAAGVAVPAGVTVPAGAAGDSSGLAETDGPGVVGVGVSGATLAGALGSALGSVFGARVPVVWAPTAEPIPIAAANPHSGATRLGPELNYELRLPTPVPKSK